MTTKPRSLIKLLLLSALTLAWAGSAFAGRNIIVDGLGVTVTVSSLNAPVLLNSTDTILVRNGGTLFMNADATIGALTIGDSSSPGNVAFDSVQAWTLTVAGDVQFGPNPANLLDMTLSTQNTIRVGGGFLTAGMGTFRAGAATIDYNSPTPQQVTAFIGATGVPIQYKNLILSGNNASYPTNVPIKYCNFGVSVQGMLLIAQQAVPTGGSIAYGPLATLVYGGTVAQQTTLTEWPASPILNIPVTINNTAGVTLDTDKSITAISPYSLTVQTGVLNDGGHTLSVQGSILNGNGGNAVIQGAGKLVLNGNGSQTLAGSGTYGNVILYNNAVLTANPPNESPTLPVINGRLTIQVGKLTLPNGANHYTSLLTYAGSDKPFGSYGSSISGAANRDDSAFDNTQSGVLFVLPKQTPRVTQNINTPHGVWSLSFGDPNAVVSGNVVPPAGPPNLALYGDGAQPGELVSNVLYSVVSTVPLQTNLAIVSASGSYSVTLNSTGLPIGNYTLVSTYLGGINLASGSSDPQPLAVIPRPIGVIPDSGQSKIFGNADPILTYHLNGTLLGSDQPSGQLTRDSGEAAGTYAIQQGTLVLNANYTIYFTNGVLFTINKKPISVTMANATKVYNNIPSNLGGDPPLNRIGVDYTIAPQLNGSDQMSGSLQRAAGENVGFYALSVGDPAKGGLTAGPNYQLNAVNTAFFTITILPITVTFNPVSKNYGDPDPQQGLPGTYGQMGQFLFTSSPGLASGDQWTSTYSTNRDAGETVAGSPYTIRPTPPSGIINAPGNVAISGGKAGNYAVTFTTTGKLAINRKAVTVTALSSTMTYGSSVPPQAGFEINYAGFIAKDNGVVPGKSAPDTPATTTPATPVTSCSFPSGATPTNFTVVTPGTDANYVLTIGSPNIGTVAVNPAPMAITAINQSKSPLDGKPFPTANYTVSYNKLNCSDTATAGNDPNNAFSAGALAFSGNAITATTPGAYQIVPSGWSSWKYNLAYITGYLTITPNNGPTTNTPNNLDVVWYGTASAGGDPAKTTNLTWFANQATGTAGTSPGWSLQLMNTLTIQATANDPFRLDLVTLAGNVVGKMAKFDPTRPYSWEIVRTAHGITWDGNQARITLNWQAAANQGANLFQNQTFNGQFSVSQSGNSLYLAFTPMGSTGGFATGGGYNVPVPAGYDVGTDFADTSKMLGSIYHSDVDMLWLSPNATTITPQGSVTINLNVANLKQSIIGVDAYINFDSRFFDVTKTVVAPSHDGVWENLLSKTYNVGGDLDTVVAVNLNNTVGTAADGTVAKITLTPTKTATGKSRVVFRHDGDQKADNSGPLQTDLVPISGSTAVLPARVMTDEITINLDNAAPAIDVTHITATQVQPYLGSVGVKNPTSLKMETVATTSANPSQPTDSGPVVITIPGFDFGVGLSAPPTLTMVNGAFQTNLPCSTPFGSGVSSWVYNWSIPANVANGTWTAAIVATDLMVTNPGTGQVGPNTYNNQSAFTLVVNTAEVSGVVEIDSFAGTNRTVTFKSGGTAGLSMSNQWDLALNFISGPILSAGAYQDVSSLATKIKYGTNDSVTAWLRNGTILNLSTLVSELVSPAPGWNVSTYVYTNEFGSITSLPILANQLWTPTRNIDVFVRSELSPGTMNALAAYIGNPTPFNASVLTRDLLYDFNNNLVLGGSIWDAVRFAGINTAGCNPTQPDNTVAVNRCLLESAYPTYVAGNLNPVTAQGLSVYNPSVGSPSLATNILADFATLSSTPILWPPHTQQFDQGLYNQTMFLGVPLSQTTSSLLTTPQTGLQLVLLNQYLLQDAYAGLYQKPPLSPATLAAAAAFVSTDPVTVQAFATSMTSDLNLLINGGKSIYNVNTFASFTDAISYNIELMTLLLSPHPLPPAQQVRENRLLLETAYNVELSKSVLASFRLVQVPNPVITGQATPTQISAKTRWNLRVTMPYASTLNFVNNGVPGWTAADSYLRGGDVTQDNVINLFDYNVLRMAWPPQSYNAQADINGDGAISFADYVLLETNWGKTGDPEVTN
jgi:MBG domain (YGX type)